MMRRTFLVAAFLTAALAAFAQSGPVQEVGQALRRGDAAGVAAHFDQTVVIELLGEENLVNRTEAQRLLAAFFSTHKPSGFKQSHSGASEGKDSQYLIGDLNDAKGKYRVYLFFKTSGGKVTLQELRINQ